MAFRLPRIYPGVARIPHQGFNAVEAWLRAITPQPGKGMRILMSSNGTTFAVNPGAASSGSSSTTINEPVDPQQFLISISTSGGTDTCHITPGVVNQMTPDPSTVIGAGVTLSGSLSYVYLSVTSADGISVNGVSWTAASSLPTAPLIGSAVGAAPTAFTILLGYITGGSAGSRVINQIDYGPFTCQPRQVLLTPASSVAAGGEAYLRVWNWVVKGYN